MIPPDIYRHYIRGLGAVFIIRGGDLKGNLILRSTPKRGLASEPEASRYPKVRVSGAKNQSESGIWDLKSKSPGTWP